MAYEDRIQESVTASEYVTVLGDDTYYYEHQFLPSFPKKVEIRGVGIHRLGHITFVYRAFYHWLVKI